VLAIAVFGLVLRLVLRDEDSARRLGRRGDRIVNWVLRFFRRSESDRVERAVLGFRDRSVDVMRERGWLANKVPGGKEQPPPVRG
jgi:hypothetical protein